MPGPGINYEINASGNFARVNEKNAKALEPIAQNYKAAAKEAKELERAAQKVLQSIQTPQEKFNKTMENLGTLLKKDKIDMEQYGRAVRRAKDELKSHNQESSFLGRGLRTVLSMGAGWLSVSSAIASVNARLEKYRELQREAGQSMDNFADAFGPLQQLAEGKELAGLVESGLGFKSGANVSYEEAGATVFALKSISQMDQLPLLQAARKSRMIGDVSQLTTQVQGAQMSTPELGDFGDVLRVGLGASAGSSFGVEAILRRSGKVSAMAKPLGLSAQEAYAITGVAMSAAGNEEEGQTRIKTLLEEMRKKGFARPGDTFEQMLSRVDPNQLDSVAFVGYGDITSSESQKKLAQSRRFIAEAMADPNFIPRRATGLAREVPLYAAQQAKEEARAARGKTMRSLSARGNMQEAVEELYEQEMLDKYGFLGPLIPTFNQHVRKNQIARDVRKRVEAKQQPYSDGDVVGAINAQTDALLNAQPKAPPAIANP